MGRAALAALLAVLAAWGAAHAQEAGGGPARPAPPAFTVFDMPRLVDTQRMALERFRAGDARRAIGLLERLTERYPEVAEPWVALALVRAGAALDKGALDALERAVALGFRRVRALARNPAFQDLRASPRLDAIAARAESLPPGEPAFGPAEPAPAPPGGFAPVSPGNTGWDAAREVLRVRFETPRRAEGVPVAGPRLPEKVAGMLARWHAAGTAAGNAGDLYDNRDGGHSALAPETLPQLARTRYAPAARSAGIDRGLQRRILFDRITIGNSSTAITAGALWRSQARLALTTPGLPARLAAQYAANHLYVYPEHRDHDPEKGDLFPANTPYMLVSQGSSGSDRPLLRAVGVILAALRPEVKTFLAREGLIAPTVQMVFRRGLTGVESREDYLSWRAHPSAVPARRIDLARMARRANGLTVDAVPPAPRLAVRGEEAARPGRDYFAPPVGERLFDTPSAIARVVRSTAHTRRFTVSAGMTEDPNGRPLTFHWRVLRGDRERIAIETRGPGGAVAEIAVPWHAPRPVPGDPERMTHRVDIAVFADNGAELSAPAFVSLVYPPRQRRRYDAAGRILSVDYAPPGSAETYADPRLFPRRAWRDDYLYDEGGRLVGWRRTGADGGEWAFTHDGALIRARDARGRPAEAEAVRYVLRRGEDGLPRIVWEPTGARHGYRYEGPGDRVGRRVPLGR